MVKKNNRKTVLIVGVSAVFFLVFVKLIYIQIILHSKIDNAVKKMINCKSVELPKRGDILDFRGRILALSVKKYTIFLDPKLIEDFARVKRVLLENGIEVKKEMSDFKKTSYVPVAFNIDSDIVDKVKNEKLKGVGFESKYVRQYPEGRILAHILGIIGSDGNGLEGVEKTYDGCLHGDFVTTRMRRDGRGYIIQGENVGKVKVQGCNIALSIDIAIQFIVEQELRRAFDEYKAKKAMCIVQNPKTGSILAMVSLPDFNSSAKIDDISLLRNSAISDIYEPGSTFKIVTVSAALDLGRIKFSDSFYLENGRYKVAGHTIRDNHKIQGSVSLSKVFEQSSNIGMVKIAREVGIKDFYKFIRKFGFYSLTGIDLPGESKGLLMNIENWNALSLPTISFGQGIGVTALQMINAFSAIANNGVLMRPMVIQNIETSDSQMDCNILKSKKIRRVVSVETAMAVRKLLKNAVDFGTGKNAKISGYTVGGKTGTSQKVDPATKTYSAKCYTASFCGMIPAINPEIVILVVIDEPKGSYYASSVASPIFANIAERVVQHLEIEKDDPVEDLTYL
jgi:cell division protein FtsI (penicillin-binding protein 3)